MVSYKEVVRCWMGQGHFQGSIPQSDERAEPLIGLGAAQMSLPVGAPKCIIM